MYSLVTHLYGSGAAIVTSCAGQVWEKFYNICSKVFYLKVQPTSVFGNLFNGAHTRGTLQQRSRHSKLNLT